MRSVEEIKADIAIEKEFLPPGFTNTDLCELETEMCLALTASVPIDRLEALCAAERDGRPVVRETCQWEAEDEDTGTFECSKCTAVWTLNDGGPFDNNMRFCPQCGREITSVKLRRFNWETNEYEETVMTRADAEAALAGKEQP